MVSTVQAGPTMNRLQLCARFPLPRRPAGWRWGAEAFVWGHRLSLMTSSSERNSPQQSWLPLHPPVRREEGRSSTEEGRHRVRDGHITLREPSTADRRHNEWESTPSPTPSRQLLPRFARQLAARQRAAQCHSWPCSPPPCTAISLAPPFPALSDRLRSPLSRRAEVCHGWRRYSKVTGRF